MALDQILLIPGFGAAVGPPPIPDSVIRQRDDKLIEQRDGKLIEVRT